MIGEAEVDEEPDPLVVLQPHALEADGGERFPELKAVAAPKPPSPPRIYANELDARRRALAAQRRIVVPPRRIAAPRPPASEAATNAPGAAMDTSGPATSAAGAGTSDAGEAR